MKRILTAVCLMTALLALRALCPAAADTAVNLSARTLCVGDRLLIDIETDASTLSYRLYRDGEQLGSGSPVSARSAAFCPQTPGQYTLTAVPDGRESEAVTVPFMVYDMPALELRCGQTAVRAGEMLDMSAVVTGGAPAMLFNWSVWRGTECLYAQEGPEADLNYAPFEEGEYFCALTVTDDLGHTASAVSPVIRVSGVGGIQVRGDLGRLPVQGGVRSLTVSAPAAWSADTADGFITLLNTCGDRDDVLTFAVSASSGGARTGTILITSAGMTKKLAVSQSAEIGEEEESYLFENPDDVILIDGVSAKDLLAGSDGAEYTLTVTAGGPWTVETDAPFLHAAAKDGRVIVRVDANTDDNARSGNVILRSGPASAALSVGQTGLTAGACVREVLLDRDSGAAYRDSVRAAVLTGFDADRLWLRMGQDEPISFDVQKAERTDRGLRWQLEVPLTGSGVQDWLFFAENGEGSADKALARITVMPEQAVFAQSAAAAVREGNSGTVTILTTQSTESIEALDTEGALIRTYTVGTARVDRWLTKANAGRYARWVLAFEDGLCPARLRIGEMTVPVTVQETERAEPAPENGFTLYSQMDGTWKHKAYRKSSLEHSGCAIFTLSHALQLLGLSGESISPERLAKTYAFCLVDGGTLNSTLIGNAGKEFGFRTRYELYTKRDEILRKYSQGALFSFSIAPGHIALTDRVSDDRKMCHIIDSAPSATFERISGATPCRLDEKTGEYVPLSAPSDIPGVRFYIDTDGYDGAEYWLPLDYIVKRGVRLIQK